MHRNRRLLGEVGTSCAHHDAWQEQLQLQSSPPVQRQLLILAVPGCFRRFRECTLCELSANHNSAIAGASTSVGN